MPELEELIDAMIRGEVGEDFDKLDKVQIFQLRNMFLKMLTPALSALQKIKAAAWEEGAKAWDSYLLEAFASTGAEEPKNPYEEA